MRLIDADAFSRTIGILADKMDRSGQIVCEQLQAILGCYECEDAVEVVRCKDCKCLEELHYEEDGEKPYIKRVCKLFKRQMQLNDFCSYGVSKV